MEEQIDGPIKKFIVANTLELLAIIFMLGGVYYSFQTTTLAVAENRDNIKEIKQTNGGVRESIAIIRTNQGNFKDDIQEIKDSQKVLDQKLNDVLKELRK